MYSITQDGHALSESEYKIDKINKTFIIDEVFGGVVIDFGDKFGWTFTTGNHCIFKTGEDCTFKTGSHCTFNTDSTCIFNTGGSCVFSTLDRCIFSTGDYCTFNTNGECTFNCGSYCTFNTGRRCTFNCGAGCTYMIYDINQNVFKNVDGMSIIFDRKDNKSYALNKELAKLLRIIRG